MSDSQVSNGPDWAALLSDIQARLDAAVSRVSTLPQAALDALDTAWTTLGESLSRLGGGASADSAGTVFDDRAAALADVIAGRLSDIDLSAASAVRSAADLLAGFAADLPFSDRSGNDFYFVGSADDVVSEAANGGTDTVWTSLETYTLGSEVERLGYVGSEDFTGIGNAADNSIRGLFGGDTLSGLGGNDALYGLWGDDTLAGGAGDDKLWGGFGNDTLIGGAGADQLFGGLGADVFVYTATSDSAGTAADTIIGFSAAGGDVIDLSAIDAKSNAGTANDAFVYVGSAAFSGTAGELRFADGVLQGDTNGDKIADLSINLSGTQSLDAANLKL